MLDDRLPVILWNPVVDHTSRDTTYSFSRSISVRRLVDDRDVIETLEVGDVRGEYEQLSGSGGRGDVHVVGVVGNR